MRIKKPLIVVPAVLAVAGGVVAYSYFRYLPAGDPKVIRLSGNIEVTDAELSFKLGGLVSRRFVNEGELVRKDQQVATLDSADLQAEVTIRQAELKTAKFALAELESGSRLEEIAAAKAAVAKVQSNLNELKAGSRPQEIAAAQARVASAKAKEAHLKDDYERFKAAFKKGAVNQDDLTHSRGEYLVAVAGLQETQENLKLVKEGPRKEMIDQAQAALDEAKAKHALVKAGPRKEAIDQARARVEQAKAVLALAQTRLAYSRIDAPFSGIVLSENIEPGEYVAPGTPVVTIGKLETVWLRAYINETDLGKVKLGQKVRVTTDTYPEKTYEGRITFIASQAEFTPRSVQTTEERVKLVYRIKIGIPNPKLELKPGMPADAEIIIDNEQ